MKVIVTGATGFIGSHLIKTLLNLNFTVTAVCRDTTNLKKEDNLDIITLEDFFSDIKHKSYGKVLIHLLGAAHSKFTDEYAKRVNFDLGKKIVDVALAQHVKRVVFISSAGLYSESVNLYNENSHFNFPSANVLTEKLKLEKYLIKASNDNNITYTIIRSPLVYGEGVKANFSSLMQLINKSYPLPFRSIKNNKRSLISVYNLVDLIKVCIEHPKAANQVFLASDDNDLSTAEMVALIAKVQGKKNLALPVPVWCFKLAGKLLNKNDVIDRLTGSLQLDITHTKSTLDWTPPYSMEHGFKLAAKSIQQDN